MKFIVPFLISAGALGAIALAGAWTRTPPAPTLLSCSGPERGPDVILCEDFEDPDFQSRWDIGGHQGRWPLDQFVRCTSGSFGFHSKCAAWSNYLIFDNEWGFYGYDARRQFPRQYEFYVRWYQYISDPYQWGSLEDKSVFVHDETNTLVAYVGTNRNHLPVVPDSGPGMPFVANYQDVDRDETGGTFEKVNRFQNQGRNITLQPGHWYLIEWYIRHNTPGQSDGETKLWVDEASQPITSQTLRMHYTDMRWLGIEDAGRQFAEVRMTVYNQRCLGTPNTCPPNGPEILEQSQKWDNMVVSKRPIGPFVDLPERTPTATPRPPR